MRRALATILFTAACGGAKPAEVRPAPTMLGDMQEITAPGPELSAIARAAARALKPGSTGKVLFGSVYLNGRELGPLSDSVARSIGATRVESDAARTKVPYAIARCDSPACGGRSGFEEATYSFRYYRAGSDLAYVGGDAKTPSQPDGGICITLRRVGLEWELVSQRPTRSPKTCGQ